VELVRELLQLRLLLVLLRHGHRSLASSPGSPKSKRVCRANTTSNKLSRLSPAVRFLPLRRAR
jgi:hypothetical protein